MDKMTDLKALLRHDIQMLRSAEEQIIDAMPAMIEKASHHALKEALQQHLAITEKQHDRLNQVNQLLGASEDDAVRYSGVLATVIDGTRCKGMEGIIDEGKKMMAENLSNEVMDAAIIGSNQKIEHFEIACYGTARTYAEQLGFTEVAQLLQQTLLEEHDADDRLTALAVSDVNMRAEVTRETNG